ncbi:hypothetical protein V8J88_06345 [Massilia sp. W12]|uniref:hypothetical protein n=1 Tax=Massilia sp. W12 TaxID=3126507 RepID=UPI0030CC4E98
MFYNKYMWEQIFKGYMVRDCTLGFEHGRIGFYLVPDDDREHLDYGWYTRFVAVKLSNPIEKRFYVRGGDNLDLARLSAAWEPNQTEFLLVDVGRSLWSYKPNAYKGSEPEIPFDGKGYGYAAAGEVGCSISRVTRVEGTVFAVGGPTRIFQRMPNQQWYEHKGIPLPAGLSSKDDDVITETLGNSNFFDLAGFSLKDMYVVGDAGQIWHFNGNIWKSLAFPSNLTLQTVTCGGDGQVYITDIRGSLWQGRGERWKLLHKGNTSIPYADSAWFKNRFWCANDYGMMVLEDGKLVAAHQAKQDPIPTEIALHAHRIDVSPDGKQMLVCGGSGAALHNGERWELLFSGYEFEDE